MKADKIKHFFSEPLIQLENGALKKVRVETGANYPEHLHPDKTEYIYVLAGNPHFLIGSELFAASPDEFYVFPVNVKHAIRNESENDCLLLVGSIKI